MFRLFTRYRIAENRVYRTKVYLAIKYEKERRVVKIAAIGELLIVAYSFIITKLMQQK